MPATIESLVSQAKSTEDGQSEHPYSPTFKRGKMLKYPDTSRELIEFHRSDRTKQVEIPQWMSIPDRMVFLKAEFKSGLEAFGFRENQAGEMDLPILLQSKLSHVDSEVQALIAKRYDYEGDSGLQSTYAEEFEQIREKIDLIREDVASKEDYLVAQKILRLLRRIVFFKNDPQKSVEDYTPIDVSAPDIVQLTDADIEAGFSQLALHFQRVASAVGNNPAFGGDDQRKRDLYLAMSSGLNSELLEVLEALNSLQGANWSDLKDIFNYAHLAVRNYSQFDGYLGSLRQRLLGIQLKIEKRSRVFESKEKLEIDVKGTLLRVSENMGLGARMPSEKEFRDWVFDRFDEWAQEYTREEISWNFIEAKVGDETINFLRFYDVLQKEVSVDSDLKQYLEVFDEQIFPFAKMVQGARRFKIGVMDNYTSIGDYQKWLARETREDRDTRIVDIYRSAQVVEDGFDVPFAERWRAAQIGYEKLYQIHLIRKRDQEKGHENYYVTRYNETEAYRTEAFDFYGYQIRGGQNLTRSQAVEFSKAKLLTEQPQLEFLTIEEAMFLIKNVGQKEGQISPHELTQEDVELRTRTALKLFTASGPVRADSFKNNPQEFMYGSVVSDSLDIKVKAKQVSYQWRGAEITANSHYLVDDNGWVVKLESALTAAEKQRVKPLLAVIEDMIKYGGRVESIANDLSWATLQMAQADVHLKGFQKEYVWYLWNFLYSQRYWETNYAGPKLNMARVIRRIILSYPAQVEVDGRPGQTLKESLIDVYSDPSFDLDSEEAKLLWTEWTQRGEDERLADNLGRAVDMFELMQDWGKKVGIELASFSGGGKEASNQREKVREALKKMDKIIKYWIEMFPDDTVMKLIASEAFPIKDQDLKRVVKFFEAGDFKSARILLRETLESFLLEQVVAEYISHDQSSRPVPRNITTLKIDTRIKQDLTQLKAALTTETYGSRSNVARGDGASKRFMFRLIDGDVDSNALESGLFEGVVGAILEKGIALGASSSYHLLEKADSVTYFDEVIQT